MCWEIRYLIIPLHDYCLTHHANETSPKGLKKDIVLKDLHVGLLTT